MPEGKHNLHFQTILNTSPDIVVLKDAESRWLELNQTTLEIFGLDREICIGKTDAELGRIYPHFAKYVPFFMESDRQAWAAGKQISAMETVITEGEEKIYNVVKIPLYDAEGNPEALVVLGREISDLVKSEKRYETFFSNHLDGVYSLDETGRFLDVNQQAEQISGYRKEELLQMHFSSLIVPEMLSDVLEGFDQVVNGYSIEREIQLIQKDGKIKDIHFTTIPAMLNGKMIGIHGIAQDISERRNAERIREQQNKILAKIAAGKPLEDILRDIIEAMEKVTEGIGSIMFYEKETNCLTFGYGPNLDKRFIEKIDKFPVALNHASCGNTAYTKEITISEDIERDPKWEKWRGDALNFGLRSCWSLPILSTNGLLLGTFGIYYNEIRKPLESDIDMLRTFSYITGLAIERHKNEEEIQYLANHDALTGLPNLRYLRDVFPSIVEETQDLAIMFLDLDQFKTLNDTFGHEFGDLLLQEVAKRIQNLIGETNVAARMGGDEFVLLIRNAGKTEEADSLAGEILKAIEKPFGINGQEFHITASIGISLYDEHGRTLEQLMKNADVAMYSVKAGGRNSSRVYALAMNDKAYELYVLQGEFYNALKQNQFLLYYQPKVDVHTGIITGVEALVRWNHPEKGIVNPATFIPLAEESGFILELGTWVLREACRQIKAWKDTIGLNIRMAVNVSVKQFLKQDVAAIVKETLAEFNLPPECLEIEITESVLSTHESLIQETVAEFQKNGVKVSIDDFGTGYASLTYLKQFRANTLKIDRSFIQLLPENQEDAAIVSAVITLAKELNMSIIAEGVETQDQLEFLIRKGCNEVQGYYFSKPLPAEEICPLLSQPFEKISNS